MGRRPPARTPMHWRARRSPLHSHAQHGTHHDCSSRKRCWAGGGGTGRQAHCEFSSAQSRPERWPLEGACTHARRKQAEQRDHCATQPSAVAQAPKSTHSPPLLMFQPTAPVKPCRARPPGSTAVPSAPEPCCRRLRIRVPRRSLVLTAVLLLLAGGRGGGLGSGASLSTGGQRVGGLGAQCQAVPGNNSGVQGVVKTGHANETSKRCRSREWVGLSRRPRVSCAAAGEQRPPRSARSFQPSHSAWPDQQLLCPDVQPPRSLAGPPCSSAAAAGGGRQSWTRRRRR